LIIVVKLKLPSDQKGPQIDVTGGAQVTLKGQRKTTGPKGQLKEQDYGPMRSTDSILIQVKAS
jgi:hypothetical protein